MPGRGNSKAICLDGDKDGFTQKSPARVTRSGLPRLAI